MELHVLSSLNPIQKLAKTRSRTGGSFLYIGMFFQMHFPKMVLPFCQSCNTFVPKVSAQNISSRLRCCLYKPSLPDSQIIAPVNLIQLNTATGLAPIIPFSFWCPAHPLRLTSNTVWRLYSLNKTLHNHKGLTWLIGRRSCKLAHTCENKCNRVAVRRFNRLYECYNEIVQFAVNITQELSQGFELSLSHLRVKGHADVA